MKFSSVVLCTALGAASAFAPSAQQTFGRTARSSTTESGTETKVENVPLAPAAIESTAVVNGSIEIPAGSVGSGMDVAMPIASVPDRSRIQP